MFLCHRPRHIIIDTALHIETLVKLVASNKKIIKFIYNYREFGKNLSQLYNEKIIDAYLYERIIGILKIIVFKN